MVRVGTHTDRARAEVTDWQRPLEGKVALVTGASRGIGEQIARVLHRDGATVVGVDVPQAASELQALMRELDGDHLTLDITAKDAPQRIAHHLTEKHGGVDVVVHNAGITQDKKLANMDATTAGTRCSNVNLIAPERITRELLDQGVVNDNGAIIGVASIAGIAGNVGQTNYAASKAGVIGLVDALARRARPTGITVNAVAPGFIITQMTAAVPFATREVGPAAQRDGAGRPAGRRRRDHRLVRQPRLHGRQRQRGPRLRPDDAGSRDARWPLPMMSRRPRLPVDPASSTSCPASARTRDADPTHASRSPAHDVAIDARPRGGVRRGVRLPAQGHACR